MESMQKIKTILSNSIVLYGSCGISIISSTLLLVFNVIEDCDKVLVVDVGSYNNQSTAPQYGNANILTEKLCDNMDVATMKVVIGVIAMIWSLCLTVIGFSVKSRLNKEVKCNGEKCEEIEKLNNEIATLSNQVTARSLAPQQLYINVPHSSLNEQYNEPISETLHHIDEHQSGYEPSYTSSIRDTAYPSPANIV